LEYFNGGYFLRHLTNERRNTMNTVKTYIKGQVWDDELKANVYHDSTLKEALAGFPSLRPDARAEATAEVHRRAEAKRAQRADLDFFGALRDVLEADPVLKRRFLGIADTLEERDDCLHREAGDNLDAAARMLMRETPALTYAQAFAQAKERYPAIAQAYAAPEVPPPDDKGKAQAEAGNELDRLTRQRMTMLPGEAYSAALRHVMAEHPDLKEAYGGTK
jgi:hypothetical protein